MKLKQFIFALVAMLSFGLSTYAQDAVVVNSFAELKAVLEKGNGNAGGAMRIANSGDLAGAYGPVKLSADIVLEGVITVTRSYLELDLNGFTISGNDTKYIKNLTSTTISDGSINKTGVIACPIYNGDNENKVDIYLKIQGGTFKNLSTSGAAITNYGECEIYAGNFFSEDIALINHNSMEINGGTGKNVYIEGKNHTVENSGTFVVDYVAVAGTEEGFKAEVGNNETVGENIDYYRVAVNGQYYGKLQDAINAAGDGDLVRLFGNITESNIVIINKAITLDGNGKKLTTAAGIKVAATGTVNIKDFTVEGAAEYALYAESPVEITNSTISGAGAVYAKVNGGRVGLLDTNLTGTTKDVIRVASNVTLATEGGSITATAANDNFIVAGDDECTGALLSIMTDNIIAENYVNLNTENNTVRIKKTHEQTLYNKGYATEKSGNALTVYNAVANVGNKNYRTLAEALTVATDGATVTLLWADYKAPIAMAGTVCGNKTVTITGTAEVDWSKGFLFVGRNGEGNGKVIFENANLTSTEASLTNGTYGINVSMAEYGKSTTNDGEVVFKNSNIDLSYLIGKNNVTVDGGKLTVWRGFAVGARPASETNNVQRTSTMNIINGANVVVKELNGMGLGYEANGVMNIDATSTFETTQSFLVTAKGTMNVNGGTVNIAGTLTNNGTVYATGAANLDATVTGAGWFYMNGVSLDADTKLTGAKVAFINGENTVKGSILKDGWFSVGVGQNAAAETVAAFAAANGITLGNVTVNVSDNATIYTNTGDAYSGWVGSAYSADKTQHTYTLNINNSLARFGYMHVSKDGVLSAKGHSDNKYEDSGNTVDFYVGTFIDNGVVTLDGVDAFARYSKISVDHADAVLNIVNGTTYEANCTTGDINAETFRFYKAGTVNVDNTSSVNIAKGTVLVEGAKLNIAGNVTANGAVTGNGTITLTDAAALYTAPADIAVVTNVDNKVVVYENAAYQLKAAVAKINGVCYLTFAEAMAVANATTGEVTVEIIAPVEFVNGMELKGNYTTINFVGTNDEAKMTINQSAGGDYLEAHGKNVNFTDLTLAKANPAWSGNSGHMGNYFSVQGGTATYTNCTFLNGACTSGGTATYTDCTFQNATEYGLWAYDDALVTVNGGTFDSKKGIKVYSEDESTVTTTLTVENATFTENVSEKPAVAIGYAASITLKGNTYNNPTAHIELDSGSDADCEGVTFVAQDADGNDISKTLKMKDRSNNNADCGVLVDGKVYTSVTTAVKDAEDGSIVTILYSTDEAVEFVPGVEIKLAKGVTAENVVVADRLKDYVVLPEDVNESNFVFKFGNNTVTDGTNYYATLQAAVEAVAGQPNAVLYCKPGANVGSLQHAPVTSTLTVYGNGANVTGNTERDFDLGNTDPSLGKDITADMTLTVKRLNGCGAWGTKATEHTVNLVFENCANMGKVLITGTTGTLNITMTDCAFEGVINEAIYSNADGVITLTNVAFSNLNKAVNLNHKAAGTQTVTIEGCTFTNCGADVAKDEIPVRVLSSVAGAKSVLTVNNSTFTGTIAGGADILLDYDAIGLTNATITNTNANVKPENESGDAEMVAVTKGDVYEYCNADVQVGETKYRTFGEAVVAVKNGGTITLLNDITATDDHIFVQAPDVQVTIEGNNKTFAGTITVNGKSAAYPTAALTIKNVKFDATNIKKDASINLGGNNNIRYTNGVTVDNCTFTGEGKVKVGVKSYTGGCKNLTITNCTATGMHSLAQLYQTTGVTLTSNTVTDSKNGVSVRNSTNVTVTNCTMDVEGYGVRADGGATVVVEDSKIDAFIPVVVREASKETLLTFNGANTITASNTDDIWCAIGTSEYEENGNLPTAATGKVRVTLNDAALDEEGVYGDFVPVAMVGTEDYATLEEAFKAATSGCTIEILKDVTIDYAWDNRNTGSKFTVPVTINGNDKIIKFTASVKENNYFAPFRFQADATVKNLTIDMSEVTDNRFRAISSNANLTVDGCKFIGKDATLNCRAIIFGEGAGASVGNLVISITNSEFINWKRGITDNENGQDVKSVTISGNTLTNAAVGVSAKENVTFTGNTVSGAYVNIKSYTAGNKLNVTATDNTLQANTETAYNVIDAGGVVEADDEFIVVAKGRGIIGYVGTDRIWGESWGNARESYVVKVIDANGNVMGTTSLKNINGILNGDVNVTWSINFAGTETNYWVVNWITRPSIDNMPAKVELWIDGDKVNEGPVQFNAPDGLHKICVIVTDEEGYIANCHTTFAAALDAVQNGETINILNVEGEDTSSDIEFTKDIEFTITGNAPNYALPVVTFQNAIVNIKDAEILIPELDARQNAVINVKNSTVHDAGGNSIVKSYYNGTINIDANSTVYAMQVTTMGYINVEGTLNATWQTNVYGNGMITVKGDATFNTAALKLTAQDYSGRDNTDPERVGKPATIIVDGATLTVGMVLSDGGADYSYNSSHGINVGTIDGKNAVLDIKNGATVNIFMADGETANIGANGTVNVAASTLNVACRAAEGTATLANAGTVYVTGASNLAAAKVTGEGWFYMNGVSLGADTELLGANVRFASGTNTVDGSTIDNGMFQVGVGAYNGVDTNVDTANGVVVNVMNNAKVGSSGETYAGWVGTGFYDTDAEKAAAMTGAKYVLNIDNSIAEFGYLHVSNDGELNVNGVPANKAHYNSSEYAFYAGDFIINGTANFTATDVLAIYTKVSCDNGTDKPGTLNINAGTEYEAERHNGAIAGTNFILYKAGVANVAQGANLHVGEPASIAAAAKLNIAGEVEVLGTLTNNGTINFTEETATLTTATTGLAINEGIDNQVVIYVDGTYKFAAAVAEIGATTEFYTLAEAVEAAEAGATVVLLRDATGAGVVINKNLTIDFADFTYTFNEGVGSTGTESNGFQILKNNTVTLMNGTLNVAESAKDKFYTIIQNYANLTVKDMNLDGTNLDKWSATDGDSYVLSVNSGNVVIEGETNITANNDGDKAFAFDACTNGSYTAPVVKVYTTGTITGKIENSATIELYSGTYSYDVTEYCADGYAVVDNHNGTFGVEQTEGIEELVIVHEDYEGEVFENQNVKTIQTLTYTRNLEASGKYLPFCLPFEIPVTALGDDYSVAYFNNVHAYDNDEDGVIEKMTVEVITIKTPNAILRANTPYLIKANSEQARALSIELTDATLEKSVAKVVNMASASVDFTVGGVYSYMSGADVLSGINNDDAKCFYPWAGAWYDYDGDYNEMVFSPFEVYLTMAPKADSPFIISEEAMQSIETRVVGEEFDGTTYIYDVVIEDGEEVIYDLQGRRVNDTEKGIYIKGGKKVLVK